MGKCFQIASHRGCFQELLPLLATCSATYAAVQVHSAGRFSSALNHALVIICRHLDSRVALPLHGPIEDALQYRVAVRAHGGSAKERVGLNAVDSGAALTSTCMETSTASCDTRPEPGQKLKRVTP